MLVCKYSLYRLPCKKSLRWNGNTEIFVVDPVRGTPTDGERIDCRGEVDLGSGIHYDYVDAYPHLLLQQKIYCDYLGTLHKGEDFGIRQKGRLVMCLLAQC